MIMDNALKERILSTMTSDPIRMLAKTAEELNELGKEVCKIIHTTKPNNERIIEELADVLIMLVALTDYFEISDLQLVTAIIKVCEKYEAIKESGF